MNNRAQAEKRGRRAENYAALILRLKGYEILARRYKTKLGEIDLIASKKNTLVIVEVKHRKTPQGAEDSLTPMGLARIGRAAELYVAGYQKAYQMDMRFDAFFVLPRFRYKHIKDAWRNY